MAWTTPRTYTVGEIITKAILDTHVRDNLKYLKGESGVPTVESGLIIDNTGGDEYLQIPSLTTTERGLLTPVNGMIIYNETTTEFNKYEAGAWVDLADNTDHGGLDGLGDDDHTQYALRTILTTRGDIIYRDASVWARLAKGTAGHYLKQGANDPEWAAGTYLSSNGTYTGNASANRATAHGLGVTPKGVIAFTTGAGSGGVAHLMLISGLAQWAYVDASAAALSGAVTAMDATNFYVGNAANYSHSANFTNDVYYWVAWG